MLIIALTCIYDFCTALDNGYRLPPMGWNSWNHFGCNPTEELIKQQADAMASANTRMKHVGYQFIIIDDCWMTPNRATTEPPVQIADPLRFPSGMQHLSGYVHSKGLKFGLYSARCNFTCQKNAGSFGHEVTDAQQWAHWELDYLKLDECYGGPDRTDGSCHDYDPDPLHRLGLMTSALNATGRHIFFSNEIPAARENYPPGQAFNSTWMIEWAGSRIGNLSNMWRTSSDISAGFAKILSNADSALPWNLANLIKPGAFADPDMLEVGNGHMTEDEDLTHFALWCFLAAPLLAGNDLRSMSNHTLSVLTASELIEVDQDPLVIPAIVVTPSHPPSGFNGPFTGVPTGDYRRCGACCGAHDTTSIMCKNTTWDGGLYISKSEIESRCLSDNMCVGFGLDTTEGMFYRPVTNVQSIDSKDTKWKTWIKKSNHCHQLWVRPLADKSMAVMLLNRGIRTCNATFQLADISIKKGDASLRDLWLRKDLHPMSSDETRMFLLRPHAMVALKIRSL